MDLLRHYGFPSRFAIGFGIFYKSLHLDCFSTELHVTLSSMVVVLGKAILSRRFFLFAVDPIYFIF
jgi:hypothetical protein